MKNAAVLVAALAVAGFALLAMEYGPDPRRTALAYLIGYAFILSIPLGALAWSMVCDAAGAVWFVPLRRSEESITAALPMLALLFLPIVIAVPHLYPWAVSPDASTNDLSASHHSYLQPLGFALRAAACFACWIGIAETRRHWSLRQERPGASDLTSRRRALSAAGLLPLALTVTIAAVDWYMSLEPTWNSTIYGLIQLAGDAMAGTSVIILVAFPVLIGRSPTTGISVEHAHALGNLLLTSVLLWAYLSFMQLLVVWMADLPDEAAWYVVRFGSRWGRLGVVLIVLHGIVPWMLLMFRAVKRHPQRLAMVAIMLLAVHYLDIFWQIAPAILRNGPGIQVADIAAVIGVGGCALACALWRARHAATIAYGDPDLAAGMAYRVRP